jgi:hypothetical protein
MQYVRPFQNIEDNTEIDRKVPEHIFKNNSISLTCHIWPVKMKKC